MNNFSTNEVGEVVAPCLKQRRDSPVHWIEIVLVGEDMEPIPDVEYRIILPTNEIVRGYLDDKGRARVDGIPTAGTCQVTFPMLDEEAWKQLS